MSEAEAERSGPEGGPHQPPEAAAAPGPASGAAQAPAPRPADAPPRRSPAAALTLLALALLAMGFVWNALRLEEVLGRLDTMQPEDPARLAALETRIAALERRPPPAAPAPANLAPLEARIAALEARPAVPAAPMPDPRVDALAARVDRLASGTAALAAEEAALRLAYPAAASAAARASRVTAPGMSLPQRMWAEVRALVTVRAGGSVLSGPPAAPALERARVLVDAGDIAGAVKALDGLDPGAAQAMAAWRARAEKLVAARAALAAGG